MKVSPTLDALQAEIEALRARLVEREQQLYHALRVVAGMWNQHFPLPFPQEFMNAGEDAEEVLKEWDLLPDETAIYFSSTLVKAMPFRASL